MKVSEQVLFVDGAQTAGLPIGASYNSRRPVKGLPGILNGRFYLIRLISRAAAKLGFDRLRLSHDYAPGIVVRGALLHHVGQFMG
jgi:hypothetical protein